MKIRQRLKSNAYGLALLFIFGIALLARVYYQYDRVFADGWARFYEVDPWYHMRQIENVAHHFPHLNSFDPYMVYPGGNAVSTGPFVDLLIGFIAWVVGLGSPSQNVIDTVGAWAPAVMGALITIPVYVIGRELFNRTVGIIGAALVAILPGQILWRSMLGFPDHHVAELLFSTLTIMFIILAIKKAQEKGNTLAGLRNKDWKSLKTTLIYSLLAGVMLGLYLLSWRSGAFLVFIIFAFVIVQFIIDHLRERPTDYLGIVFIPAFLVALILRALPIWSTYKNENLQVPALIISILAFGACSLLSYGMVYKGIKKYYYPLLLIIGAGIGIGLFHLVDPSRLDTIFDKFTVFNPSSSMQTIAEVQGISLTQIWSWFAVAFYISLISLAIMGYFVFKGGSPTKTLLFVWGIIVLVATIGQNRNAYYLAITISILTAYFCWRILDLPNFTKTFGKNKQEAILTKKEKHKGIKTKREKLEATPVKRDAYGYAYAIVAIVVIFFLVFFPNIGHTMDQAETTTGPDDDWHESLVWMKDNTPDPFGDPDFFFAKYNSPTSGGYMYPESAYGVMSLWEYGYWITYMGHRIPNGTGGQGNAEMIASFFTSQSESEAIGILDQMGSKYVMIDYAMATLKFPAITVWAGKDTSEFFDMYHYVNSQGALVVTPLYYPAYYRSMSTRLYTFEGKAWDPDGWVKDHPEYQIQAISYIQREGYRELTDVKKFDSYAQATKFINDNSNYIIIGNSPYISPVPLEELTHFELIHKSPKVAITRLDETVSLVETFEYSR